MLTKCTALFQLATSIGDPNATQRRLGGWSETVYCALSEFALVKNIFQALCQARAALLPRGAVIVGQRYQQVNPVGPSQTASRIYPGSASLDADVPQMCLNMRCAGVGVRNIRPVQLRGIPDARVIEGEYDPSQRFEAAIDQFAYLLGNFSFRGRDLSQPSYPLFTVDTNGVYSTEVDTVIANGQMVRVLRTSSSTLRQVGERCMVSLVTSPRSGTIKPWPHGPTKGGQIRIDAIVYPQFVTRGLEGRVITVKKVGRPFKQYRGRASRRM